MKKITLVTILGLLLSTDNLFAQSIIKIIVPEVKEGKLLDSLFDNILPKRSIGVNHYFFHTNSVNNGENHYNVEELLNVKDTIIMHFNIPIFIENLSYFKYKGIVIFTYGGIPPSTFIRPTAKEKLFIFKWNKELPIRIRPTRPNYDYSNGRLISTDDPY